MYHFGGGVPIIRTIVCWGLSWVPLLWETTTCEAIFSGLLSLYLPRTASFLEIHAKLSFFFFLSARGLGLRVRSQGKQKVSVAEDMRYILYRDYVGIMEKKNGNYYSVIGCIYGWLSKSWSLFESLLKYGT